jgi:hypothetical protein
MDPQIWKTVAPYIVPLLVILLVGRRLIKNPARKVRVGSLWIMPLIVMAATIATLVMMPKPPLFWVGGYALAAVLGGTVGFLTSHHQEFSLDYDTGTITSKATPIGTILIAALFALRFGLKMIFPQLGGGGYSYGAAAVHPSADLLAWTDAGLIFSTGLLIARAATTYLRARPLLEAHKAHKATVPAGGPTERGA